MKCEYNLPVAYVIDSCTAHAEESLRFPVVKVLFFVSALLIQSDMV